MHNFEERKKHSRTTTTSSRSRGGGPCKSFSSSSSTTLSSSKISKALPASCKVVCAITILLSAANYPVACSPPIDYFVYTSQLAAAKVGTQSVASILPSLESIYEPTATTNNGDPASAGETTQQQQKQHLEELSNRVLSLIGNYSHRHDNDLVDLEAASYAWTLMEKQALQYTKNRVATLEPFLAELLKEAQVSDQCQRALLSWLDRLQNLDRWAALMWNAWGEFPPAGLFEGSYTDLGSYKSCMSIKDNEVIGQPQYCTLDFQPLVPTRPRFHSIFKRILDVDSRTSQLNGGDFDSTKISSRHSAHGFTSSRFNANKQSSDASTSESLERTADSRSDNNNNNKYSKRTITQNGTENVPATAAIQHGNSSGSGLSYTLKTEALTDLALKAQFFYYVKFRLGACFPSKCSPDDVQKLAQSAGRRAILQANQVSCMKKEPTFLNVYQQVAIWTLSILAMIAFVGTAADLLNFKDDSSALASWLLPFSIWTNSKRLFDSKTAGSHTDLGCIHGLRFFSMLWVIYGHTILYTEYQSFTHFYEVIETQIPSFLLLPTLNANFSVDTFFVISGILTTYVTWEYTKGDPRKFNKFAFAISRYIRLTPQLAIVILCFFLLPLFGSGPMFRQVTEDKAQTCYNNWAINLLYMQSYINSEKLCIEPSWWLSIEMTFHMISIIIIAVMIHNPAKGMAVNFLIATVLTLWGAIIHYTNGFAIQYLPSIPQRYEVASEQTQIFFHRPYPHAAAYFIGIALGYVLANRTVKKLTRTQIYQGWTFCAIGFIVSLWSSYYWNLGAPYTQLQATIYYNLCQILWPASIAWIILACALGHGGFVDSILSARCFVPLGRITYMTYLSHSMIIYYHSASMNVPVEPSMLQFIYMFLANTFISMILGVILTVVYESPVLNLQKNLFAFLTQKFDPTIRIPTREMPTMIVCDKNGTTAASAMLMEAENGKPDIKKDYLDALDK